MEPSEDLVIRLSAAVTLRSALDDFEFNAEQFLPFLERSFSLLFTLLKETEECETKVCYTKRSIRLFFIVIFFPYR
jgi:hypothetical protein